MSRPITMTPPSLRIEESEWISFTMKAGDENSRYVGRVIKASNDMLLLGARARLSGSVECTAGAVAKILVIREDSAYRFEGRVVSLDNGPDGTIAFQRIGEISRLKRRQTDRIGIRGWAKIRTFHIDDEGLATLGGEQEFELLDISAGGVGGFFICLEEPLRPEKVVLIKFPNLITGGPDFLVAQVRRLEGPFERARGRNEYLAGIVFLTREEYCKRFCAEMEALLPPGTAFMNEGLRKRVLEFVDRFQVKDR